MQKKIIRIIHNAKYNAHTHPVESIENLHTCVQQCWADSPKNRRPRWLTAIKRRSILYFQNRLFLMHISGTIWPTKWFTYQNLLQNFMTNLASIKIRFRIDYRIASTVRKSILISKPIPNTSVQSNQPDQLLYT